MQATSGQAPFVWAKGIRGLSVMWCLLHNPGMAGTDGGSHLRGQREAWLATTGACEWAPPANPAPQGMGRKKK